MKIEIKNSHRRFDPFGCFQTEYERMLLERFKAGHRVVIWRGSCPSNVYIENPADESDFKMISGSEADTYAIRPVCKVRLADFMRIGKPDPLAGHAWAGERLASRNARLYIQAWVYDAEAAERAAREWTEVEAALAVRQTWPEKPAAELHTVSRRALAVLRAIQPQGSSWHVGYPYPEVASEMQELEDKGVVKLVVRGSYAEFEVQPAFQSVNLSGRAAKARFVFLDQAAA